MDLSTINLEKIEVFMDSIPEGTVKIKLKLGSTRIKQSILKTYTEIPTELEIQDRLLDGGFGESDEYAMLIALNDKGEQVKTKSLTQHIRAESAQEDPIRAIGEEYRLLMAESRRMLTVNNDLTAALLTSNLALTEQNMDLRENIFEVETEAAALKMAADQLEEEGGNHIKEQALTVATQAIDTWKQKKTEAAIESITLDQLTMALENRPDLVAMARTSPALINLFLGDEDVDSK